MLPYRQLLTLSTNGVVIFGSGGLAIAQTPSPNFDPTISAAEFTQESPDILNKSEDSAEVLNRNLAAALSPDPKASESLTILPDTLLAHVPAETAAIATKSFSASGSAEDAVVARNSETIVPRLSLLEPLPNEGSLIPANVVTKVATRPNPVTQPSTFKHLGEFSAAIASPKIATATTPISATVAAEQTQPGTEVIFSAQASEETETIPTLPSEAEATETVAPAAEAEFITETPRSIPRVSEIPEDFRTNEELQQLLAPIENELLMPPVDVDQVLAGEILELTLAETVEQALAANQDLREAQLTSERARYALREAIAAEYPTLSNQTDLTHAETASGELQAERIGNDESDGITSLNSRLELSYDIYTGGRRSAQIDAASTQLKITELDVERITKETRLSATTTYYDLQSAGAQVAIEQSAVVDASETLEDAKLLEQAGLGTKFDVLRAQVELANAQQRLTRANANQNTVRRQLAQLLNLSSNVDPRAADEIDLAGRWELSLEESILLALQQREELRQQLLQREIDGYQKEIALAAIRPQISIFANYDFLEIYDDDLDVADGFSVGARMRWNLFDGGAATARANQEEVDQAIAENRFLNQSDQIRLAVETAYYNLIAGERNIQTASVAVELAEESLRLARLRFNAGVGTQTDVIAAQTELTTAQNNLEQAITDYNRAYAQLKREVSVGEEIEMLPQ